MWLTNCQIYLIVVCLLIPIKFTYTFEWIEDDAVYITAGIETRSPGESDNDGNTRLPGKCVKLRDCYPIFFLTDRNHQDDIVSINSDLIDFILETIDVCQPESFTNRSRNSAPGDTYVWCRIRSPSNEGLIFPGLKPALVGVKAENDDVCGQSRGKETLSFFNDSPGFNYKLAERVVGGTEIAPGEAPYLVAMTFRGKQVCGGSVIDEQHILTAAHCVSHLKPTVLHHLRLLIGDHNLKDLADADHQERNVSKVIYHREFSRDTLHDDIAMVKLSEPVQYTSHASPVCLADGSQPFEDGTTLGKLVGWGQVSDNGERPFTPRTANLRIWKTEDCEEIYESVNPDENFETSFCAGGFQDGGTTDACRGDSGGPLTITRNNRIEQVGVVSYGIGCGRYPGVFTKVESYTSWIDRHRTFIFENE